MRILPVLDLLHGQVVRGIAGQRDQYRPIVSLWTTSADPLTVAQSLHEAFGFSHFYVADLDAILHRKPNFATLEALVSAGFRITIDAGIRTADDAFFPSPLGGEGPGVRGQPHAATQSSTPRDHCLDPQGALRLPWGLGRGDSIAIVLGLETLRSPGELSRIAPERILFSLDLKAGTPLGNEHWPTSPRAIADLVIASGIRRVLILDLAKVGVGDGLGTDELCRELRHAHPNIELLAGGGVRGLDDLLHLESLGLDAVLVASALHDGRLMPQDVTRFE